MTSYFKRAEEQAFLDAEWRAIAKQRGYSDKEAEERRDNLCGLALSGGGIRSASFALGVLQALGWQDKNPTKAETEKWPPIDYLSTVSGGGYIGSTLSWLLFREPPDEATMPRGGLLIGDQFKSIRNVDDPAAIKIRDAILNYLRQHGNYLVPTSSLNFISLIAVAIRSIFLSFSVYLPLLILAVLLLDRIGAEVPHSSWLETVGDHQRLVDLTVYLWVALGLILVFLAACVIYSLFTFARPRFFPHRYRARIWAQRTMGWLLALAVFFALIGSLPVVSSLLDQQVSAAGAEDLALSEPLAIGEKQTGIYLRSGSPNGEPSGHWLSGLVGAISVLIGFAGAFLEFLRKTAPRKKTEPGKAPAKPPSGLIALAAAALLIYGFLLLSFYLANVLAGLPAHYWIALALYAVIVGVIVNLNYISLHRMYRDRLMEAFLPNDKAVRVNRWFPASEANETLLEDLTGNAAHGPYHLINTNVVLIDAVEAKYRGRGGDNFILSPLYCGSHATGWRSTDNYMKGPFSSGMTLPTAMAISGAAINPDTGAAGKGLTRSRTVSFLMTLLNIRLGFWAPNPRNEGRYLPPPNYFWPGFKGLRGKGFVEDGLFVELTDGGHFDNVGLYELIRRRVKFIVISDGTADPDFTFSDFGTLVERVRVDFGVNIRFSKSATDLTGILPGSTPVDTSSASDEAFCKKYPMAARGFAIGSIHYPPKDADSKGVIGKIVYIKSTLTKNLPADIYGYKSANPSFPDQSTADQFFDEPQFEAYRELGYRLATSVDLADA